MIYVSSACVKNDRIADSVRELAEYGFKQIELSGGTTYYAGFEADLLALKKEYGLDYVCHNYFPPPNEPFILNLASLDQVAWQQSLDHVLLCLELSSRLGANFYAVHAGFLLDLKLSEIGQKVGKRKLFDRSAALEQFGKALAIINERATKLGIKLYVENNVLSSTNHATYSPENPFLFCDLAGLEELLKVSDFTPLIDVAHLKVSCESLGLDFPSQLKQLIERTDYLHISDNDGSFDTNQHLTNNSQLFSQLRDIKLKDKIVTLEVYTGLDRVRESFANVLKISA